MLFADRLERIPLNTEHPSNAEFSHVGPWRQQDWRERVAPAGSVSGVEIDDRKARFDPAI